MLIHTILYHHQPLTTIFYTHGDVPYSAAQTVKLEAQMRNIPSDAEFIVFVGDLRQAGVNITCQLSEYQKVATLFRLSPVPVFVIIGDNDASDCPNMAEGLQYWNQEFLNFESRYWTHNFVIRRQDGYPDNFAFIHKNNLFVGLNIIGGITRDQTEWEVRLSAEALWTIDLIREYRQLLNQTFHGTAVGRVVLFGHADPGSRHAPFFQPISSFIKNELQNSIPIVYINGDKHEWTYTPNFYGRSSWLRIGVTGLAAEPLLKVMVDGNGTSINPEQAFVIDRRL
jgi:Calcineurin-like phosphoesterase